MLRMTAISVEQLEADLAAGGDEAISQCSERLVLLGYRMPDCKMQYQMDQMFGALFGSYRNSSSLREVAENLVNVVGLTKEDV